jgi:hypothetical protein
MSRVLEARPFKKILYAYILRKKKAMLIQNRLQDTLD